MLIFGFNRRRFHVKWLTEFYNKYKEYGTPDVLMYLVFFVFLFILIVFFG